MTPTTRPPSRRDSAPDLGAVTCVELLEPGAYRTRATADNGHDPNAPMFGGHLLAQATTAAARTVPDNRELHALDTTFLAPGDPNIPVLYRVRNLRDGRTFSSRLIEAQQDGRAICVATASYKDPKPGSRALLTRGPCKPRPENLPHVHEHSPSPGATLLSGILERHAVDIRVADGDISRAGRRQLRAWMRLTPPTLFADRPTMLVNEPPSDTAALVYLSDLLVLVTGAAWLGVAIDDPHVFASTVTHSIRVRAAPRLHEWSLYQIRADWAADERCVISGEMFDQRGRLLMTAVQEGLVAARRSR